MIMLRLVALALAATSLSACNDQGESRQVLRVASGHIVMPVSPDRPAAGYFTVEGGSAPVDLVAVTADLAQRVEMHETVKVDGMTSMKELIRAPVPVQGKLEFKPGANHLMIWNINGAAVRAGRLPMVFIFSNNDRIIFDLTIKTPEAAAKAGEDHKGH
jgi:periplasmic copper chaperone A